MSPPVRKGAGKDVNMKTTHSDAAKSSGPTASGAETLYFRLILFPSWTILGFCCSELSCCVAAGGQCVVSGFVRECSHSVCYLTHALRITQGIHVIKEVIIFAA